MSQTEVRTFRAASMQEALELVRQEMGADAVILHTREVALPKWQWWKRTEGKVEITAGTGVNIRAPRIAPATQRTPAAAGVRATNRMPTEFAGLSLETPDESESSPRSSRDAYTAAPPASAATLNANSRQAPPATRRGGDARRSETNGLSAAAVQGVSPRRSQEIQESAAKGESPVFGSWSSQRQTPANAGQALSEMPTPSPRVEGDVQIQQMALQQRLDSIQKLVESLNRGVLAQRSEVPSELFQLYTHLIDAEVEEDLARHLICQLKEQGPADVTMNSQLAQSRLRSMVERDIRCSGPITMTPGKRRVVALVGPTGVGKTTTLAKLAANFRLRDGVRLGLVTVDTYRIAAVEQLRTYAEIIDLPMKVVTGPREMRRAIDELGRMDLVLIDTAGRSPRDELKIQELKNLLSEAEVDEVHLVLSLVSSPRSLIANAEKFQIAKANSLILTKLDEAAGLGSLVSVARQIPLPVSYVTTGQDVPDDIEVADASRLARLVLGEDRLTGQRQSQRAA